MRRGILALLCALTAAALAACGTTTPTAQPSTSSSVSASASGSPSASYSPVDPAHAVAPPGPRTQGLASADILVVSPTSIAASTVKRIRATSGVTGVAQMSMAQVSVEDKLLPLIAADPATYRLFEPVQSADLQEFWDRVAGGEAAVSTNLRKSIPPSKGGYLTLGSKAGAPAVHVGAYVQPIPGLPAVMVNQSWVRSLGMKAGNALLISTGGTSPSRVVKPLRTLVGAKTTVERLDVVARDGLDPGAVQSAVVVGSIAQAVGDYTYRPIGGGAIAPDPAWVASHIVTEDVPILGPVTCNKMLFPQLKAALEEIVQRGLAKYVKTYNGCYNPRFIAGTTSLSNHAFGLAIDINAATNGRGGPGTQNPAVVQIFEKWGFTWGGTWHYTDPMHFEMNRIVHPD